MAQDPRQRAADEVRKALADGRLKQPRCCPSCTTARKLVATHPRGYDRPLDVVWRCHFCAWRERSGSKSRSRHPNHRTETRWRPRGVLKVAHRRPGRPPGKAER